MSDQESYRAAREAQRAADDGRKTPHEDAIARYLAAFAYREERDEQRDEERREPQRGEAGR